jgi:2-methylaconitate cis-trans-isomerase PrpF
MKLPCAIYRGGTSEPVFFMENDLPIDPKKRDAVVLDAFGSPDVRQIDGLGGADPLTSKVAYIGAPTVPNTDINYTFGYVGIAKASEATQRSPGVPKIAVIAGPGSYDTPKGKVEAADIDIVARMTALQKLHKAYAVTGAVAFGTAAKIEGTIVNEIFKKVQPSNPPAVRIGHPTGKLQVEIEIEEPNGQLELTKAALARTERLLMDGNVYVR